jgi:hypothetical protein
MGYGNKSFQHINESEKRYILGLYKKMDLGNIFETKYKTDIQELISDFGKSLETQKRYLSALFTNLTVNESFVILNNIKEDSVKNLFGQNKVVLENYYTFYSSLLTEQPLNPISELDRFHKFLNESISIELDRINEQMWDYIKSAANQVGDYASKGASAVYDAGKQGASAVYDAGKKVVDTQLQMLNYATDYITKTGIGPFMESLRGHLFSNTGTAIQILVSLTGPITAGFGPGLVTGIWCILGLYDLYQITQGVDGAWANFIIDVICALTAGSLGGVLSKFVGTAGKSLIAVIQNLMTKGMGPILTPVISVLKNSLSAVAGWFKWGGKFAKDKLGISWLSDKVAPAIKYMSDVIEQLVVKIKPKPTVRPEGIKSVLGQAGFLAGETIASLVPPAISAKLRTAGALAAKVNPAVWGKLGSASTADVALFAGQTLENSVFKTIQKVAEEEFKDKPVSLVLQYVDQNFGTAYSDAYLAYLGGKKMWKYQAGKLVSVVDNAANTLKPTVLGLAPDNPLDYSNKQGDKIKQATGSNETGKDYSKGIVSSILQIPGK